MSNARSMAGILVIASMLLHGAIIHHLASATTSLESFSSTRAINPALPGVQPSQVLMEDFQSLTVGNIHDQQGPLGRWAVEGSSSTSVSALVAVAGTGKQLEIRDQSTSHHVHVRLEFNEKGDANNGNCMLGWNQVKLNDQVSAVALRQDASDTRHLQVAFYTTGPGVGVVHYVDRTGTYADTGLYWTMDTEEMWEIHVMDRNTMRLRKNGGEWAGPFQTWRQFQAGPVIHNVQFIGGIGPTPDYNVKSVSWEPQGAAPVDWIIDDFQSYPAGILNGRSGPLGTWTTTGATGCTVNIVSWSGTTALYLEDVSSGCAWNAWVNLNVPLTANGESHVKVFHSITTGGFNILVQEGNTIGAQVYFSTSGNAVQFYDGSFKNTGLTWSAGWEAYEIRLIDRTSFMLRQYKDGTWSPWEGPFNNRNAYSSTGTVVDKVMYSGNTNLVPKVHVGAIAVGQVMEAPPGQVDPSWNEFWIWIILLGFLFPAIVLAWLGYTLKRGKTKTLAIKPPRQLPPGLAASRSKISTTNYNEPSTSQPARFQAPPATRSSPTTVTQTATSSSPVPASPSLARHPSEPLAGLLRTSSGEASGAGEGSLLRGACIIDGNDGIFQCPACGARYCARCVSRMAIAGTPCRECGTGMT